MHKGSAKRYQEVGSMGKGERAVIYCRVSTSSDSQMESLDKQVLEAVQAVEQLGYELVDQFIDEGRTGTVKETRKEYLRMLSRIEENEFDVIVTKSLDRMNRNILDFYLFLDLIMKNNVRLYFYLDRDFYKADDKIVIGIKAILAEEYSRELSKKLCSAHAKRQERGEVIMLGSQTYGYRKVMQPDGKRSVVIEETEAEMIRLIFDYCREGYGARAISGFLLERGYHNRRGNPITESTIRRIIRNPLVTGTMIMNKVKFDFNSKTLITLEPSQWIWKEDAVPPIITAEVWRDANAIMDSRIKKGVVKADCGTCGINRGKSYFSGKIICGLCKMTYYKVSKMRAGETKTRWSCSTYVKFGKAERGCNGPTLDEQVLVKILGNVVREFFIDLRDEQQIVKEVVSAFDRALQGHGGSGKMKMLQEKLQTLTGRRELLLKKYLDGRVTDEIYAQMDKKLSRDAGRAKKELANLTDYLSEKESHEKRLVEIEEFLRKEGFEKALAYALLENADWIVIYPDYLEIQLAVSQLSHEGSGKQCGAEERCIRISLEDYEAGDKGSYLKRADKNICGMIEENPHITIEEMAERLGVGKRTVSVRIAGMKAEGVLETQGHGPGTARYVRTSGVHRAGS